MNGLEEPLGGGGGKVSEESGWYADHRVGIRHCLYHVRSTLTVAKRFVKCLLESRPGQFLEIGLK
jgi:hypothetical protein